MAKKKQQKKQAAVRKDPQLPGFITALEQKRFFPIILFSVIAILYFSPIIFQNVTLNTTEGVMTGFGDTGREFTNLLKPLTNSAVWTPSLGGMPASEAQKEVVSNFIRGIFEILFLDFRAYALYLAVLSVFAACSMYFFLRAYSLPRLLAAAFGVAYMLAPHIMSLTYAGHFSKMGIMAALPLLFLFLHKGMKTGKLKYFLWFGFLITIDLFFGHPQLAQFSLLAVGVYFLFELILLLIGKRFTPAAIRTAFFTLACLIGLGMGARAFLPQYLYTKTSSKRAGQEGEGLAQSYATSWGLHMEEFGSMAVPEFVHYDTQEGRFYWGEESVQA